MTSAAGGFAVANTEDEHKTLTAAGYGPGYVEPEKPAATLAADADAEGAESGVGELASADAVAADAAYKATLTAKAEASGIKVDARWGVKRLEEEIAKHG